MHSLQARSPGSNIVLAQELHYPPFLLRAPGFIHGTDDRYKDDRYKDDWCHDECCKGDRYKDGFRLSDLLHFGRH